MIESIPWPAFSVASAGWVLASYFYWLSFTGKTVSKATHDARIADLKEQLEDERHEKGEWRTQARLNEQTISELSAQNQAMLKAFGPTLTDFLESLRRAGVGERTTSGGDSA